MKTLTEYPTPETDEIYRSRDREDLRETFAEVRNLEQRLLLCQAALGEIESMAENGAGKDDSDETIKLNEICELAQTALEATNPKP